MQAEKLKASENILRGEMDSIIFSENTKRGPSVHVQRRMNVLNQVLMERITDFMSTGELDHRLEDKCIEISHVKITQDFKIINIYWIDNSIDMSDTEKILDTCAYRLRYELCQLRIMGNLPPIKFVKCKHMDRAREVERKLAIADYGEDYQPTLYPYAVNHIVSSKSSTDNDTEITDCINDTFSITLPVMSHDVFDLNHHRIMSKIKASLTQSRQSHKQQATSMQSTQKAVPDFLTTKEQEEQFSQFLKRKQHDRRLKRKEKRSMNVIHHLIEENENDLDTISDDDHVTDDDYVTDDNYGIDDDHVTNDDEYTDR
ncbi:uncharacterized protein LOC117220414 isoform X1 [Megalopta genalis]|uniref:uncharacterized protein LOC117220414 isoform X1 n=1 Tax=Megalopta genalis TaxID=115081 RepID=UPI003FCF5B66